MGDRDGGDQHLQGQEQRCQKHDDQILVILLPQWVLVNNASQPIKERQNKIY